VCDSFSREDIFNEDETFVTRLTDLTENRESYAPDLYSTPHEYSSSFMTPKAAHRSLLVKISIIFTEAILAY